MIQFLDCVSTIFVSFAQPTTQKGVEGSTEIVAAGRERGRSLAFSPYSGQ